MKEKLVKIRNDRSITLKNPIKHKQIFELHPDDDFKAIEKVLIELLMSIGKDDRWQVQYRYAGRWVTRVLNEYTILLLLKQLSTEGFINNVKTDDMMLVEEDYDYFFPVSIPDLDKIVFENKNYRQVISEMDKINMEIEKRNPKLEKFKHKVVIDNVLEHLKKSNAPEEVIAEYLRSKDRMNRSGPKKHLQGSFWKWTNTTPIDLSRYGIFNELNSKVKDILNGDNCFIYACKMAGVSEEKLRMMREIIRVESFPKYKIKEIAEKLDLKIAIKDGKSGKNYTFGIGYPINILLYEDHYMINEDLPISPFYIKNYHEIENNNTCRFWSKDKKRKIILSRSGIETGKK
jgi:hypothetical protein